MKRENYKILYSISCYKINLNFFSNTVRTKVFETRQPNMQYVASTDVTRITMYCFSIEILSEGQVITLGCACIRVRYYSMEMWRWGHSSLWVVCGVYFLYKTSISRLVRRTLCWTSERIVAAEWINEWISIVSVFIVDTDVRNGLLITTQWCCWCRGC